MPTLPILYLGYHIPAADPENPDTAALGALAQAVFGETSPLYKALVLDEQKVVLLVAEAEAKRDPGPVHHPGAGAQARGRRRGPQQRIEAALAEAAEDADRRRRGSTRSSPTSATPSPARSTAPTPSRWPSASRSPRPAAPTR